MGKKKKGANKQKSFPHKRKGKGKKEKITLEDKLISNNNFEV